MKIAVAGCVHGELETVYKDVKEIERRDGIKIGLLIICGDVQTIRNEHDIQCVAVPQKYKQLGQFHKYYSGEAKAPVLTVFVGGNHEASNYLSTLPYGGWVAKNIYYLGYASVIRVGGLRIAGVSGIYRPDHCNLGHFEHLPYDEDSKRSIYHVRNLNIYRLMQLGRAGKHYGQATRPIDVLISHDWPLNIHIHGDATWLQKRKPNLRDDIRRNSLGNPLYEHLLGHLKPRYWFAAHLHVRFEAVVDHSSDETVQTRFLALDKCLPGREYLEVVDIESQSSTSTSSVTNGEIFLEYDPEYLCILRLTNSLLSVDKYPSIKIPEPWEPFDAPNKKQLWDIAEVFSNDFKIPENFEMSEPVLSGITSDSDPQRINNFVNPQTTELCAKLGITDPIAAIINSLKLKAGHGRNGDEN